MRQMGRLEFTTPREAWGGEAASFTPLLGQDDMLEYLGETTGIGPLIAVEVEHSTAGHRSLDILAETADGRRVAIENQYGVADHDHLTRGLAYAVATKSIALIVIAEDHRDEFVSVVDYLNEIAGQASSEGILVWLVQVRAVRRQGDEVWSPEFVVQAEPNKWEAAVRRESTPVLSSLEEFYEKCATNADETWAETARRIIDDWLEREAAREFHGNVTQVSLYYRSPKHGPGGTNVLQVDYSGGLRICRGYVWETSGVFDESLEPTELDAKIREYFPQAIWAGQRYFIRVPDPDPEVVGEFSDWITARFDAASEVESL
jgi:hypothetical protein